MRKRTVRTGLRFMVAAVSLLLLGTFYSQQINTIFSLPIEGAIEFVKLTLFWGGILGAAGVVTFTAGLLQRSSAVDNFSLAPTFFLFVFLLVVFFTLFYRSLTTPPAQKPLRPGETLVI